MLRHSTMLVQNRDRANAQATKQTEDATED